MGNVDDTQVKYIEKILEANLNTIREELRGIRNDMSRDRSNIRSKVDEVVNIVEKHEGRIDGLEKLWSGVFTRLAFVAALGGMLMAIMYEWLKKKIGILP